MKEKIIWLDDIREPTNLLENGLQKSDIMICRNYFQFVEAIQKDGLPEMICFDHDLGEEKTGYDCAKFVVDYCIKNKVKLSQWRIQLMNIVVLLDIDGLLKKYKKHENRQ